MTPERWLEIKTILQSALELPASERDAFVRNQCGDDLALLDEVESFLQGHDENFLVAHDTTPATPVPQLLDAFGEEPLRPGEILGHYRIERELSRGGMGIVYRARDIRLNRDVALKILPPGLLADEERRCRFLTEAQAAAALHDPHIATVFEIDETDGITFIAMELISGVSLAERLSGGALSPEQALAISLDVAEGLTRAHCRGIVHRDLKPANIMITEGERAKVIDFGLAKLAAPLREEPPGASSSSILSSDPAMSSARHSTQSSRVMGTRSYMSPEQAAGGSTDARSDVFSFGVVLHEMLTGSRPFDDDGRRSMSPLPAEARSFQPILDRCLAEHTADRYVSAEDLASDLRRLAREMKLGSGDRAGGLRAAPWPLLVALVLALLGVTWMLVSRFRGDAIAPSTAAARETAVGLRFANPRQMTGTGGLAAFAAWSPDGRRVAYHSNQTGNFDIWVTTLGGSDPIDLTEDFGGDDLFPVWSPDGTAIAFYSERDGGAYFVVSTTGGKSRHVVSANPTEIESRLLGPPQWSPDGTRLAILFTSITGARRWIEFVPLVEGPAARLNVPGRSLGRFDLAWSPDGRYFAYVDAQAVTANLSRLWVMRATDGEAWPITDGGSEDRRPTWSRDSRTVYFVSRRGGSKDLWRQRLSERGEPDAPAEPVTVGIDLGEATLDPDEKRILYSKGTRVSNIWSIPVHPDRPARWNDAEQITFDHAFIEHLDLAPDGRTLVVSTNRRGSPALWLSAASGGEMHRLTGGTEPDWAPRWSPDGREIAFYSHRSGNRDLWIVPASGEPARQVTRDPSEDLYPAWSPDGRLLAFASDRTGNWDIWIVPAGGGESRQITSDPAADLFPEWSADGTSLFLVSTRSGQRAIWRAAVTGGPDEFITNGNLPRVTADGTGLLFIRELAGTSDVWIRSLPTADERAVTDLAHPHGSLWDEVLVPSAGRFLVAWKEDVGDLWTIDVVGGESPPLSARPVTYRAPR